MTNRPDPLVYLEDILQSLRMIRSYIATSSEKAFLDDPQLQDAVIRRLLVIGEASARMPEAYKLAHPDIPWHKMSGMRNRLVHGYAEVDMSLVWDTVQNDLPPLETSLGGLLGGTDVT
ncbi:HepT-like ribonuclease domain-containing protein [Desulfoferula mesophila]|uniref:DUF86 domain-containing protein n=1 Tax=Desulfoferula mesophila TaxID=3058419 RepID=A0AAU9EBI3_9BACT|nr:DUF86 domain-containing protein [Desulfoferula mesophilus]